MKCVLLALGVIGAAQLAIVGRSGPLAAQERLLFTSHDALPLVLTRFECCERPMGRAPSHQVGDMLREIPFDLEPALFGHLPV